MSRLVWILVVALVVLHQDNWFWTDRTLVFGFMPIGLFYHMSISIASAGVWFLATQFCWPLEQAADTSTPRDSTPRDGTPRDGTPRDGTPRDGTPRDGGDHAAGSGESA